MIIKHYKSFLKFNLLKEELKSSDMELGDIFLVRNKRFIINYRSVFVNGLIMLFEKYEVVINGRKTKKAKFLVFKTGKVLDLSQNQYSREFEKIRSDINFVNKYLNGELKAFNNKDDNELIRFLELMKISCLNNMLDITKIKFDKKGGTFTAIPVKYLEKLDPEQYRKDIDIKEYLEEIFQSKPDNINELCDYAIKVTREVEKDKICELYIKNPLVDILRLCKISLKDYKVDKTYLNMNLDDPYNWSYVSSSVYIKKGLASYIPQEPTGYIKYDKIMRDVGYLEPNIEEYIKRYEDCVIKPYEKLVNKDIALFQIDDKELDKALKKTVFFQTLIKHNDTIFLILSMLGNLRSYPRNNVFLNITKLKLSDDFKNISYIPAKYSKSNNSEEYRMSEPTEIVIEKMLSFNISYIDRPHDVNESILKSIMDGIRNHFDFINKKEKNIISPYSCSEIIKGLFSTIGFFIKSEYVDLSTNYFDITSIDLDKESIDNMTFIPARRFLDENREKYRQTSRVGRVLRKLNYTYSDKQIEEFSEKFRNIVKDMKSPSELNIVRGGDISYWYLEDRYLKAGGSLNSSCMRYANAQSRVKFYDLFPEKIGLLIMTKGGKLLGRALVWKLDDGRTYMDRIYTVYQLDYYSFVNYAKDNNMLVRGENREKLTVTLPYVGPVLGVPYLDSFAINKEKDYYRLKNY